MNVALKRGTLAEQLTTLLPKTVAEIRGDEPMAPKTSVRVGGAAEAWVRPLTPDGLVQALRFARDEGVATAIVAGGANTLVGDGGIPGITFKLAPDFAPELMEVTEDGGLLTLCGGAAIARLIVQMKNRGLVGAEFLAGIPGTLGGAVTMNAGTKMGECMSVVDAVEVATVDGVGWIPRDALNYRYRHTDLPRDSVVTRVRFALRKGDLAVSQEKMETDLSYRKRTQPLSQPNFGSVFKNPEGHHAGKLLEAAGLKGFTVGRAQFSMLHANWIVNLGGATAAQIVSLMETAMTRVKNESGIELMPEVKRVGSFL